MEANTLFWEHWNAVRAAGVFEYVPHLVEAMNDGASILHALPIGGEGEDYEQDLAYAARMAALDAFAEGRRETVDGSYDALCPVPTHMRNVELVGIARLRHRPHTRMTAAWHQRVMPEAERMAACYRAMSEARGFSRASM